jgi:hypothetical protein
VIVQSEGQQGVQILQLLVNLGNKPESQKFSKTTLRRQYLL